MVAWIAHTEKIKTDMKKISAAVCRMLGMGFLPRITLGCLFESGALGFPFQLAAEVVL